jgi:hypothetical protein
MGSDRPVHHTVVELDVTGSGTRDDQLQLRMRADLHAIIDSVLTRQSLDAPAVHRDDRGDGTRLIVPAHISPQTLINPFLPDLAAALWEHHKAASETARLRLRVAIHMGLLYRDIHGWAGTPLVHSTRLVNARPVRHALATAPAVNLVVVVSGPVYHEVVCHTHGVDPATYVQVAISEKETQATAWVHIPGPFPPARLNYAPPDARTTRSRSYLGRARVRRPPTRGRPPARPQTAGY